MVAHNQGIGTAFNGQSGVLHILNAFQNDFATPALFNPFDITPIQARVKLLRCPGRQRAHVFDAADMPNDVAKLAICSAQHAQGPAGFGGDVEHVGQRQFGRRRQAILQVFMTLPQYLQIERNDQRRAVGSASAFNQAFNELAIAHDIELKPKWVPIGAL